MNIIQRAIVRAALVAAIAGFAPAAVTNRGYYVGNSLAFGVSPSRVALLAAARGKLHPNGYNWNWNAPLDDTWNNPGNVDSFSAHGLFTNALVAYDWDSLILQPYQKKLLTNDVYFSRQFIALAATRRTNIQVYIFERWPGRSFISTAPGSFSQHWVKAYVNSLAADGTEGTREYLETLTRTVATNCADLMAAPALMIPVGEVLYRLDTLIMAGAFTGLSNIYDCYSDGVHFNSTGNYIAGCCFYATIFKDTAIGLPYGASYGLTDPSFAAQIQTAVWDVVRTHPLAGVLPEPCAGAALIAVAGLARLGQRAARRR